MATRRPDGRVEIKGLKDFQRELRRIDKDLPKELRKVHMAAAQIVATGTRAKFARRPGVTSAVPKSVKAMAQQRSAVVRIGGKGKAEAAIGHEFGGGKYRRGNPSPAGGYTTQFPAWRGSGGDAGYALYPTLRQKTDELIDLYGDALEDIARRAFPQRG